MDIPLPEECIAPNAGGGPLPPNVPPEFDIPLPSYSAQSQSNNGASQQVPQLPLIKNIPPLLPGITPSLPPQQQVTSPPQQIGQTPPPQVGGPAPPGHGLPQHQQMGQVLGAPQQKMGYGPPQQQQIGHGPTQQQMGHEPAQQQMGHGPAQQQMGHGPPQQQMGHGPPQQQMGHGPPQQQMGHGPPQQQMGHGPPQQQMGHGPPQQQMGHGPPQQMGHGLPQQMGHGPPQPQLGHGPPQQQMGHGPPQQQMGHGPPQQQMGHGLPQQQMGRGPPHQQMGRGPPQQQMGRGPPQQQMGRGPPQQQMGHGPPHQQKTGHNSQQQKHGHNVPQQQMRHGPPQQQRGHGPHQQQMGHGPPQQMGHGPPQPQMGHGPPQQMGPGPPQQQQIGHGLPQQPLLGHAPPQQQQMSHGPPQQQLIGHGPPQQQQISHGPPQQQMELGLPQQQMGLGPPQQQMGHQQQMGNGPPQQQMGNGPLQQQMGHGLPPQQHMGHVPPLQQKMGHGPPPPQQIGHGLPLHMGPSTPQQMRTGLPPTMRPPHPPQLMQGTPPQPLMGPPPNFMQTPPPSAMVGPLPPMLPALPQQPAVRPPSQVIPIPPPQSVSELPLPSPASEKEKPPENNDESNKYSPSHAGAEDDVPTPSVAKADPPPKTPPAPRATVLGKAQAKKRLLAFSMTKQGGGTGVSFGFSKKNAVPAKVATASAKEFVVATVPEQQPAPGVEEETKAVVAKPEKPPAPATKKKASRKGSAREDKARSVIAAIEEIKREELVMRGVLSLTSLDTKCTGDMTAPIPLPGQPYVPPPSHVPLRSRELDLMSDLLGEKQRDKESLVEDLLSREIAPPSSSRPAKEERSKSEAKSSSRDDKKEASRSRRDRSHSRDKKRRSKERHGHGRKEKSSRPTEMPTGWGQFAALGYSFEEVRRIKAKQQKDQGSHHDSQKSRRGSRDRRSRSREKKHRRSSPLHDGAKDKDKDVDEEGDLMYKLLSFPSKILSPLYATATGQGTKSYPRILVKITKARPVMTYCENPNVSQSYLKSRKEVFAESPPEIVKLMELIIDGGGEKNLKKVDRSRTSDASLSNSLAALQVSYDEGEMDENLSSDDIPAGKKRERQWFCTEKEWFATHPDAELAKTNVNGISAKESDGTVKEKEESDVDVEHPIERKAAPEVGSFSNEKKYSSPGSDLKTDIKRLSLSEPPLECIKVRSKWDSDYEEDTASVENTSMSVSGDKMEEGEIPYVEENEIAYVEKDDVVRESAPVLENESKTPENMDVCAVSETEIGEPQTLLNNVEEVADTAVVNTDEIKCDTVGDDLDSVKDEDNLAEPAVTPESEHTVESPKCDLDASLNNSIASPADGISEKNTDLKLVSEYEEFMKAVSFDTGYAEETAVVSEEENMSSASGGVDSSDVVEKVSVVAAQNETERNESFGVDVIEENQSNTECAAVLSVLNVQSEFVDTEYAEGFEKPKSLSPVVSLHESKSEGTDENNLHEDNVNKNYLSKDNINVDSLNEDSLIEGNAHQDNLLGEIEQEDDAYKDVLNGDLPEAVVCENHLEVRKEELSSLPDNTTRDVHPPSSSGSQPEQLENENREGVQTQNVDEDLATVASDGRETGKNVTKRSKSRKGIPNGTEELTKGSEKSLKAEGKKSSRLRSKHLKRKRKYMKVKHSKKKTRRKRAESSSFDSSSDVESSSSEDAKLVKHAKKRDRRSSRNRPSLSSDESSSEESTTSSDSSISTQSSTSSDDRRSRKKKKKQRKKIRSRKSSKKNKREKDNQRKKHRKHKLEDSESDYGGKSAKTSSRKEEKQPQVEDVAVSRPEEKGRRKHRSVERIVSKSDSSDKHVSTSGQNKKDQQGKDDKKCRSQENSVSASLEAENSSVESCWEASFKEKRAREKLKRARSKSSRMNVGSEDENENDRQVKRRRKEHRSRSSSPKKKRHLSPSTSPEHLSTSKTMSSRDDKTRHRSRTGSSQDEKRKVHRSSRREKKRSRKDEREESLQLREHKESSRHSKQGSENVKDVKTHKRKKESRERREKSESAKSRDTKLRSKSKEHKDKSKYKDKKNRSKSKEKRKDKHHKEKSSKQRYKERELETSDDEVQTERKSFRSRHYRYRSKPKETPEKKRISTEEEHEKKKRLKQTSRHENSDVNDSDNQQTEKEDSENEETGNEDSENGEDSENQEDSENKEDSENQDSENHESDDENESDNEDSDNQSSSNGDVDDTVGSASDQFDLLREIKQEVFSEDEVTSQPTLQGQGQGKFPMVCKEESIDPSEPLNTAASLEAEKSSAPAESIQPCGATVDSEPQNVTPAADASEKIDSATIATSREDEKSMPNVETSVGSSLGSDPTDPNESVVNVHVIHESSACSESSVAAVAVETCLEGDACVSEVPVSASATVISVADQGSGCCSEAPVMPIVLETSVNMLPSTTSSFTSEKNETDCPTSPGKLGNAEINVCCQETLSKEKMKKNDSVVLYSPGAMDSDDEDNKSELADQVVAPSVVKENSLSSEVDVQNGGLFEVGREVSLGSETCQVLSVESNSEAPNLADSYTADFFCGSSWNSAGQPDVIRNFEDRTVPSKKPLVSLESIPLPPPKLQQELSLMSCVPIQAVPPPATISGHLNPVLLEANYPAYPVMPTIQPCPPPVPPAEVVPPTSTDVLPAPEVALKLRATPKTSAQKHVITVKLLSSMSRQEAMSAASMTSAVLPLPKSDSFHTDSNEKTEDAKSMLPPAVSDVSAASADNNSVETGPWKAFGSMDSGGTVSLYDGLNPVGIDPQAPSLTVKSEVETNIVQQTAASAEQSLTPAETPSKHVRKRPSRWGMMTPPVKDAYHDSSEKSGSASVCEDGTAGEKRPGPIFQIISGEKSSGSCSSSVAADIKKLDSAFSVPEENISEQSTTQTTEAVQLISKPLKTGSEPRLSSMDHEKSSGDVGSKDITYSRKERKSKEYENERHDGARKSDKEKGSSDGDKSRHRRDKDRGKHRERGREKDERGRDKDCDQDRSKHKERDKRRRERSRENESYKSDDKDSKKTSTKRSVDKSSDHSQPGTVKKEALKEHNLKSDAPCALLARGNVPDSSSESHQFEQKVDPIGSYEQPQQIGQNSWGDWPTSKTGASFTDKSWEQTVTSHDHPATSEAFTSQVQDDGWQSRVVTYRLDSPSSDHKRVVEETDVERKWTTDTNNSTRVTFECQSVDGIEENNWHGERRNDGWKRSRSRSPARHRSPMLRRSHSSPCRRSPSSSRRRSRSPSFARGNLRSSRSPARSYSPFRRRSCSPYPQPSHSPTVRRAYSPVPSRSRSPARQNYSPKRSRSRTPSLRRSPLPRIRSPSLRRNRSPLSRRSGSRSPLSRRSGSRSPGQRKSPLRRSRSPISRRSPPRRLHSPLLGRSLSPHYRRSRSHTRSRSPLGKGSRSPPLRRSRSPVSRRSRSPLPRRSLTPPRRNRSPLLRRSKTPPFRRSRSFSPSLRRNESSSPCVTEGSVGERDHIDKHYAMNRQLPLVESNWEVAAMSRDQEAELSSSSVSSPLVSLKRSIADSTISDTELLTTRKTAQCAYLPENDELYYKQGVPAVLESREDSHSPSPGFSPRRISLDDRIRLELGVKVKSPPPQPQAQPYLQEYAGQYACYYAEQAGKSLVYGVVQAADEMCYTQQQQQHQLQQPPPAQVQAFPVVPMRRPPLLPVPANVKPNMSQWCSAEAELSEQLRSEAAYTAQQAYHASEAMQGQVAAAMGLMQAPAAANSHVVQVGNFLQVVPAELTADAMKLIAATPPPPPPLPLQVSPMAVAHKPPQTHSMVLQTGNVLQVIPSEHAAATPPLPLPPARGSQKVLQVGNVLEVVPSTVAATQVVKQVSVPASPSPARPTVSVTSTAPAAPIVPMTLAAPPVQHAVARQPIAGPKSLISLPLPPLPLSGYSSPPSPFLRELPPPVSSPCGEEAQPSSAASEELRREQKEKRREEKERRRLEKERKKRNKLKLATGNIIKKALQQDSNLLDDSHEVDIEDMKLIEEAIVKVAELEDEEQPLSPVPKKKKKEKKRDVPVEFKPLPAAGKGILVFPGFSKDKPPVADDSLERKTVKFADGVRPGEGTSPSAGEDLPSPPPPPRKLPKEKHFKKKKKKKIKVKIIRQINMDDDEDDDDDISPPPPPPGSPPPPPVYPATYPGFPAPPGFIFSQGPQYTVLTTEPVTPSGTAAPVYAPLYHQHHHTTTTTHTTTVQFAAPPPPPPVPPRKPK